MAFRQCPLRDKEKLYLVLNGKQKSCPGNWEKNKDNEEILMRASCQDCQYRDKSIAIFQMLPINWHTHTPPSWNQNTYSNTTYIQNITSSNTNGTCPYYSVGDWSIKIP